MAKNNKKMGVMDLPGDTVVAPDGILSEPEAGPAETPVYSEAPRAAAVPQPKAESEPEAAGLLPSWDVRQWAAFGNTKVRFSDGERAKW